MRTFERQLDLWQRFQPRVRQLFKSRRRSPESVQLIRWRHLFGFSIALGQVDPENPRMIIVCAAAVASSKTLHQRRPGGQFREQCSRTHVDARFDYLRADYDRARVSRLGERFSQMSLTIFAPETRVQQNNSGKGRGWCRLAPRTLGSFPLASLVWVAPINAL